MQHPAEEVDIGHDGLRTKKPMIHAPYQMLWELSLSIFHGTNETIILSDGKLKARACDICPRESPASTTVASHRAPQSYLLATCEASKPFLLLNTGKPGYKTRVCVQKLIDRKIWAMDKRKALASGRNIKSNVSRIS